MSGKPLIGFVGQGFIGKSYADDLARRGYPVIRYALEAPYRANKKKIRECDIVFIAVPTPTTPRGFDLSVVRAALALVKSGATVVIKSTILPGTTRALQKKHPRLFIMHSPEFLVARSAKKDAAKPSRNILGIPKKTEAYRVRARQVLSILPKAPYRLICSAEEAEVIKYAGNGFLYTKVLFANLVYDMARASGADYEVVRRAVSADHRIGPSHLQIFHDSGHRGARPGRGAGGLCFIKDMAAMRRFFAARIKDKRDVVFLDSAAALNADLLARSGKDTDLLAGVYGASARASKRTGK